MATIMSQTEHLIYFMEKDGKGNKYYQVWEKEDNTKPIALYDGDKYFHLREDFPTPEENYKYFDEMCEVISDIHNMKLNGEF